MTEIWLVRHGQTDWNLHGRFQGQTDIPLNATGIQQAHKLAERLRVEQFTAVFSSDLSRAYQTAQIAAQDHGLPIITDKRLREICQGEWEGKSLVEVQQLYKFDPIQANQDPDAARAPGGETVGEVARRMASAADAISARYPDAKVLLVSHGLAVATLYCLANQIPLQQVHDYIPDNATPMVIHWPVNR